MPDNPNIDRRDKRRVWFFADDIAGRPERGDVDELFWATDENIVYVGNGTDWDVFLTQVTTNELQLELSYVRRLLEEFVELAKRDPRESRDAPGSR